MIRIVTPILLFLSAFSMSNADTIYVNKNTTGGNNDGTSWSNAFVELQDALSVATTNDEIWVVTGKYRPDWNGTSYTNDRLSTFNISADGVKVYGGFIGNENALIERDWSTNITNLTGDLLGDDIVTFPTFNNVSDNAAGILKITGDDVIFDGFEISGASGVSDFEKTIILSGDNITINNCKIFNNQGTVIIEEPLGRSLLENCLIYNNYNSDQGTIFTHDFGTQMINCTVVYNHGQLLSGFQNGAYNIGSVLQNCVFWGNTANLTIYNTEQVNCRNSSIDTNSFVSFENNIVEGFTGTQFQMTSSSNSDTNPVFTDASVNDYSLSTGSPAIDVGDNTLVTQSKDLNANPRLDNTTVDLGCFEFQSSLSLNSFDEKNIGLYPNPVIDKLSIKLFGVDLGKIEKISIYDLKGRLALKQTELLQGLKIDVQSLSKGTYIIELNTQTGKQIKKFLKQ